MSRRTRDSAGSRSILRRAAKTGVRPIASSRRSASSGGAPYRKHRWRTGRSCSKRPRSTNTRTTPDPAIGEQPDDPRSLRSADVIVVGTGFSDSPSPNGFATQTGRRVHMLERRGPHRRQRLQPQRCRHRHRGCTYGSHLFHTSNQRVVDYIKDFTAFNDYQHRVYSRYKGKIYPMPINLGTITTYFEQAMSPDQARALVAEQAAELGTTEPANLEEKAISLIGRPLYGPSSGVHRQAVADRSARTRRGHHHRLPRALHLRQPVLQ